MQQLTRNLRLVEPIVQHGLAELQAGAPVTHTLREVALMASLVGTGMTATRAIRQVENVESQLLGMPRSEAAETFHTDMNVAPYGKTFMPQQTMAPIGYGQQAFMPMGYGQQAFMPMGYGQQTMMPMGYGKGMGY